MNKNDLEIRTKNFAVRVVKFVAALPKSKVVAELGHQLIRSGTSIGANYREENRAESRKDFIHKISIVEKECGESQYWLELLDTLQMGDKDERKWLLRESGELLAIFVTSGRTAKQNRSNISDCLITSYE